MYDFQGEVYWNADPVEAPFAAPPLLKYPDTSRMMYIWLSDFLFNSMSYNAFKYNRLQYNVTKKDVSFILKQIWLKFIEIISDKWCFLINIILI